MGYATRAKRLGAVVTSGAPANEQRAASTSAEESAEQQRLRRERIFWAVMVLVGGLLAWVCWAVLGKVMSATIGPGG